MYIERERGRDPKKQHFVEHYKLHEVPIIFVRDKIGGATGLGRISTRRTIPIPQDQMYQQLSPEPAYLTTKRITTYTIQNMD